MLDSEFHATCRIGLNEIDEVPRNYSWLQFSNNSLDRGSRRHTFQQPTHSSPQTNVNLGDLYVHSAVRRFGMQVNIVYADDFASMNVDDLLVQEVALQQKEVV